MFSDLDTGPIHQPTGPQDHLLAGSQDHVLAQLQDHLPAGSQHHLPAGSQDCLPAGSLDDLLLVSLDDRLAGVEGCASTSEGPPLDVHTPPGACGLPEELAGRRAE